ncbi:MAG TPA: hypothetical protein DCE41_24495 [Cytophagales bacterium]|nr:hypothetical protein [Cytophagales bacterium]HAA21452.1 hypothetical protein [Cytophagales bacterium]HAP65239.1 hypothetical protein [Cytophagales bacterium]
MKEDELLEIWGQSGQRGILKVDTDRLGNELEAKTMEMDRKIKLRDRREVVASYLGMVGFGAMAWYFPWPLTQVACLIAIGWFAYVVYRLRSTRKQGEPDVSLPFREQLQARLAYVRQQARLLRTVFYWYVLPPYLMNVLFFLGIGDPTTWDSPVAGLLPDSLVDKMVILVFLAAFYGYIVWMNHKAARTYYDPVIAEMEQVLAQLDDET